MRLFYEPRLPQQLANDPTFTQNVPPDHQPAEIRVRIP
jgi:hypothetical protein